MKKILLAAALIGTALISKAQTTLTSFVYDFTSTATGASNCLYNCCASNLSGVVFANGDGVTGANLSLDADNSLKIVSNATSGGAGSQRANGYSQNPVLIDFYNVVGNNCAAVRGNKVISMATNKKVTVIAKASANMRLRFELGNAFVSATNQDPQVFEMNLTTAYQTFTFDYTGKFGGFDSTNINLFRLKFNVGDPNISTTGFDGTVNIAQIRLGAAAVITSTMEEQVYANLVNVFPNPATETLNIDFANVSSNATVKLISATGSVVAEQAASSMANFNVSGLTKGMYIVQIATPERTIRKKVMVD